VGKYFGRWLLGRPRRSWGYSFKRDLIKMVYEIGWWKEVAQYSVQWWVLVLTVLDLRVLLLQN
jgi:hypothetical protein